MGRMSEGFPFGESHLREVLTHLLNLPAVVCSKLCGRRLSNRPFRPTRKNNPSEPSYRATVVALEVPWNKPQRSRHRSGLTRIDQNTGKPFTRMGTDADYAQCGLLPLPAQGFMQKARSFRSVVFVASGRP
jgi:hypothetical protein